MSTHPLLLIASVFGFCAVAIGAFGAHAVKGQIEPALYVVYQTGVEYHFYHAIALLMLAFAPEQLDRVLLKRAAMGFVLGILLFSGSLYLMALTGMRSLGMVTPVGGVAFLCGWALLGYAALASNRR
ncbi:DUF423 domain-containing protein [Neptuniibacter caesariensis]|uniref:DUF423 domain-containing protein n=1 Tax=Neptuniibacter caesariensis TaxID=207954 RepID=A0A7U8C708_NEPCE|nr:DUF423 domain-containing protein [Neptuniibacter caesariensis]EAR62763.1 hypothetical protein MED92_06578 [Oceanospirillum sp. MED92] [Neptuniibacter caesariensis]